MSLAHCSVNGRRPVTGSAVLRRSRRVTGLGGLLALSLGLAPSPSRAQEIGTLCDTIAQTVTSMPSVTTTRTDTIIHDHLTERAASGCRVHVTGSMAAFRQTDTPDQRLRSLLPTRSWKEDLSYAADGPDGTAFALRRGAVLCLFRGRWDGGDDADSSYVPGDRYELVVGCLPSAP